MSNDGVNMFGHHPDLSTDFCCEIEMLEGWIEEIVAGLRSEWPFWGHLSRLLRFCRETDESELDEIAIKAKSVVRGLEGQFLSRERQPVCLDWRYA